MSPGLGATRVRPVAGGLPMVPEYLRVPGPRLRIVGIGDSTTAGFPGFASPIEAPPRGSGNPESQYAHWVEKARPEWTVLNRGVCGERSDDILARFPRDVLREAPDYVVVLAGANDLYEKGPVESVEVRLDLMYRLALDNGIAPVAATLPPHPPPPERGLGRLRSIVARAGDRSPGSSVRRLNAWIASTARTVGLPLCDMNHATADPRSPDRLRGSPDGTHPDVDGYRRMGEALVATIDAHLAWREAHPRRAGP